MCRGRLTPKPMKYSCSLVFLQAFPPMGTVPHPLGIVLCVRQFVSSIIKILWTEKHFWKQIFGHHLLRNWVPEWKYIGMLVLCGHCKSVTERTIMEMRDTGQKSCFSDRKWKSYLRNGPKELEAKLGPASSSKIFAQLCGGTQTWSHPHWQIFECVKEHIQYQIKFPCFCFLHFLCF